MKSFNLTKILKSCIQIAIEAGDILKPFSEKNKNLEIHVKEKLGLVSKADLTVEAFIKKKLIEIDESVLFLGEESSYELSEDLSIFQNDWCWCVDPLDGTTNFLQGLDYYSVCISLMYKKEPVLGVVFRPSNGDIFYASKKNGAYYKNIMSSKRATRLINKKQKNSLSDCFFVTGFASEKSDFGEKEFRIFRELISRSRGIRRLGSAALDICYVTKSIFDGFWELELAPWDTAAASCIAKEAGFSITDYSGTKYSPFNSSIIVANKKIHESLIKVVRNCRE